MGLFGQKPAASSPSMDAGHIGAPVLWVFARPVPRELLVLQVDPPIRCRHHLASAGEAPRGRGCPCAPVPGASSLGTRPFAAPGGSGSRGHILLSQHNWR